MNRRLLLAFCLLTTLTSFMTATAHAESADITQTDDYKRFSLAIATGLGGGTSTPSSIVASAGVSWGANFGYFVSPTVKLGLFYDGLFTTNGINFHGVDISGLEGTYYLSGPQNRTRFFLGGKVGRLYANSVGFFIIPFGSGSFSSWALGPKVGLEHDLANQFFFSGQMDAFFVPGGSAETNWLFSGPSTSSIPSFAIFNLSLALGLRF